MPLKLYGIPNCETVKKARAWLEAHGVACDFRDYGKQGVDRERLAASVLDSDAYEAATGAGS